MSDNKYNNKLAVSTQVRNFYSEGISYMNVKFFNTNLSFQFFRLESRTNEGRSVFSKQGLMTSVNFEYAYALYQVAMDIINNKVQEVNVVIPCAQDATLSLERKKVNNSYVTALTINKNNDSIPFIFKTVNQQTFENGAFVDKQIEAGLGALAKTIEGYLQGINASRHLDKLTEEYVKSLNPSSNDQQSSQPNQSNYQNYNKNYSNYKKPYNPNYNKNYNRNYNNRQWNNQQQPSQPTQSFSEYQV